MIVQVAALLSRFRRKLLLVVLRRAAEGLSISDVTGVLDDYWWALVRYRLGELGRSDLGENTIRIIFTDVEGDAIDSITRDMRDMSRDVRVDRQ